MLIYGISALLLGLSVGRLEAFNENILTMFIVVFPFVVLAVFAWLVSCHHKKLYGPEDFQDDRNFLAAGDPDFDTRMIGERLNQEIEMLTKTEDTIQAATSDTHLKIQDKCPTFDMKGSLQTESYAIEALVFQELQNDYKGTVRRAVTFTQQISQNTLIKHMLDGVIDDGQRRIGVEVIVSRSPKGIHNRIAESLNRLAEYGKYLQNIEDKKFELLLIAVISHGGLMELFEGQRHNVESYLDHTTIKKTLIGFRIYQLDDLRKKYGFHPAVGMEFYVNKNPQSNGEHEIHKQGCSHMPLPENRVYLGKFFNSEAAIAKAREIYPSINGCYYCTPEKNTK